MSARMVLCCVWFGLALMAAPTALSGQTNDNISNGVIKLDYTYTTTNVWPTKVSRVGTVLSHSLLQQDLWEVEIRNASTGAVSTITAGSVSGYTFTQHKGSSGKSLTAVWSNLQAPGGVIFQVTALIETRAGSPAEDFIRFTVAGQIVSPPTGFSINAITYPRLQFGETAGDMHQTMAVPIAGGQLWKNPCFNQNFVEADDSYITAHTMPRIPADTQMCNPGPLSMQWIALYYDNDASKGMLYHSTLDPEYYRKELRFKQRLLANSHYAMETQPRFIPTDNLTALTASPPYPYTITIMSGDWFDAAKRYRSWAMNQPWVPHNSSGVPTPMYNNSSYSTAIRDAVATAADTIRMNAPPNDPIPDLSQWANWSTYLTDRTNYFGIAASTVPIHITNWDYNAGEDAPDGAVVGWYFQYGGPPPAPLPSYFSSGLNSVAQLGAPVAPHFLFTYAKPLTSAGVSWPNSYVSYQGRDYTPKLVETFALKDELGNTQWNFDANGNPTVYNVFYRENISLRTTPAQPINKLGLDRSTQFASDYVSYVAESTIKNNRVAAPYTGTKGIYIDVMSASNPQLSWDPTAGHPTGGGTWSTTNQKAMLQTLRTNGRALVPNAFYAMSEACNEAYLSDLDMTYAQWRAFDGDYVETLNPTTSFPFSMRVTPLFDAVYHEFARVAYYGPFVANNVSLIGNSLLMEDARAWYASTQIWGRAPWIGANLDGTSNTMTQLVSQYPNTYGLLVALARQIIKLHKNSVVRDYIVFGERIRSAATSSSTWLVNFKPFLQGDTPKVVVSSFRRTDLPSGAPRPTGGIHLINWTTSSDGTGFGTQSINVTIKASDFGLLPQLYTIDLIQATGAITSLGSNNFGSNPTFTYNNLLVPPLDNVMIYIH